MDEQQVKLLLVEDDEDDYILLKGLLDEIACRRFLLDWARTGEDGLQQMVRNQHDVCLLDYRLGAHNGVEVLQAALQGGCQSPIIMLTGQREREIDLAAMRAGAADYLVKGELTRELLERTVRYAQERKRATALAAFEQARLAAFGAEVGLALAHNDSLEGILNRCAEAMVHYLNAALAHVWTYDGANKVFEPRGIARADIGGDDSASRFAAPTLQIESLAAGEPVLITTLAGDPQMPEQEWVRQERLVAYAAQPLRLEGRLVGLMSIFSRAPLSEAILLEMGSVANGLALCIEQKRAKEALDASEGRYRAVVENIKEVIFQMNEFGQWTYMNPAWAEMTGFKIEDTLGNAFLEYIHHDDREQNRYVLLQLIERKLDFCRYETRYLTSGGKFKWAEVYIQLLFGPDSLVLGATGTLTDITERKLAELQIQKLAAFPRYNPNPVLEFSADGTMTYHNDAAQQLAQALNQDLLSLLPRDLPKIVRDCIATGQSRLREQTSASSKTISWSFFPIIAGKVVHCYGADITELLNLEAQFRHAQKLDSIGQLAAGIAHDFNNVLTVIKGNADLVLARDGSDEITSGQLQQISAAAERATTLTRQLLMFSRKQIIQTRVLDLNSVVRNLAKMLPRLLGEDIALEALCDEPLPAVEADTGMIEQVIMNMAVNSRDAMPHGGSLQLATSLVDIDAAYVQSNSNARAGRFLCLSIRDTGCGMDQETLSRIFEPFFTTKVVGKGTGLGLATAYGIVKQHQGWIEVTSQVNVGTSFKVFLPATSKAATPAVEVAPQSGGITRGNNETILVVEDEAALRSLIREVLTQYGYHILEASNGVEALQLWDDVCQDVDLLLTDVVMPEGMTGFELAEMLKRRAPGLRVIYTSGYSAEVAGYDFGLSDKVFLPKPYSLQQLGQAVRDCLDRPQGKNLQLKEPVEVAG